MNSCNSNIHCLCVLCADHERRIFWTQKFFCLCNRSMCLSRIERVFRGSAFTSCVANSLLGQARRPALSRCLLLSSSLKAIQPPPVPIRCEGCLSGANLPFSFAFLNASRQSPGVEPHLIWRSAENPGSCSQVEIVTVKRATLHPRVRFGMSHPAA